MSIFLVGSLTQRDICPARRRSSEQPSITLFVLSANPCDPLRGASNRSCCARSKWRCIARNVHILGTTSDQVPCDGLNHLPLSDDSKLTSFAGDAEEWSAFRIEQASSKSLKAWGDRISASQSPNTLAEDRLSSALEQVDHERYAHADTLYGAHLRSKTGDKSLKMIDCCAQQAMAIRNRLSRRDQTCSPTVPHVEAIPCTHNDLELDTLSAAQVKSEFGPFVEDLQDMHAAELIMYTRAGVNAPWKPKELPGIPGFDISKTLAEGGDLSEEFFDWFEASFTEVGEKLKSQGEK